MWRSRPGHSLNKFQELWREATVDERHNLLVGMIDVVYVDMASRRVGIIPKGPFPEAFRSLNGALLVPPEEADRIFLWWRRRGLHLSRSIHLAARYGAFLVKAP